MSKPSDDPAVLLRAEAKAAARSFRSGWLEMAAILQRIRREKTYEEWDYKTFEQYCATELFIKPATANKLTRGYAFLEKHDGEMLRKPAGDAAPPPFELVEVLVKADDRGTLTPERYAEVRQDIWHGEGTNEQRADEMRERFPEPKPKPSLRVVETGLKRYAGTARHLYDELKVDRKVPAAVKDQAHSLLEALEQLVRNHSEVRA